MLAPRHVFFTAVEGALVDPISRSWSLAAESLGEIERRRVSLILVSRDTRAQLEPLRRKIEHAHPFITEGSGGVFLPDGYFSLKLEGATRVARYFCVPFARPYAEAAAALDQVASEAGASVVGYSQMSSREIARNTGQSVREAELARQREFSERFFFVGDTDAAVRCFVETARRNKWQAIPGDPFWELRSGNYEGRAVRHLMELYRRALRTRLSSVGIGSAAEDFALLSAVDHPIVLPLISGGFDPSLTSRLPKANFAAEHGPAGWNQAVMKILASQETTRRPP